MVQQTFEQSVKSYRGMVFRIAYGYVKSTYDADDITQEVFLKLYKSENEFASSENIKAWLIRVTVNQAKSLLKTMWKTRVTELDENIKAQEMLSDSGVELYDYIKDLKPKYRTVIYLYYYEEYSVKEIAGLLKIRETTVTTQLNRARNQLKEAIMIARAEGYS